MAKFLTTIQLQDANETDYKSLLQELEKKFFKEEIHAAKSVAYVAGKGSFSREGKLTIQEVNEAIFRATSKTGRRYSFFTIRHKQMISSHS